MRISTLDNDSDGDLDGDLDDHYQWKLEEKLHKLRQGGHSVDEYYNQMIKVIGRADVDEYLENTMKRFLAGLRRAIREKVAVYHYEELEEMVQYAKQVERRLGCFAPQLNHRPEPTTPVPAWPTPIIRPSSATPTPPTWPSQPMPVPSTISIDIKVAEVKEEKVEINIEVPTEIFTISEVPIAVDAPIEELLAFATCESVGEEEEEVESEINLKVVEDKKELDQPSMEKPLISNIFCQPCTF
ncbi:hypothetical protein C2S52_018658 [Perilla frutescens var. hirtella]|nr:hypothetical protein C2S52_018658 [Perilla frutescens var. hirtella]